MAWEIVARYDCDSCELILWRDRENAGYALRERRPGQSQHEPSGRGNPKETIMAKLGARLARRLRELRLASSLTQEDLARKLNVSSSSVARWERGATIPRPKQWSRIMQLLS